MSYFHRSITLVNFQFALCVGWIFFVEISFLHIFIPIGNESSASSCSNHSIFSGET